MCGKIPVSQLSLERHSGDWLGVLPGVFQELQVFGVLCRIGKFGRMLAFPRLVLLVQLLHLRAELRKLVGGLALRLAAASRSTSSLRFSASP